SLRSLPGHGRRSFSRASLVPPCCNGFHSATDRNRSVGLGGTYIVQTMQKIQGFSPHKVKGSARNSLWSTVIHSRTEEFPVSK
ncbi:MAG: hypothetical protein KKG97_09795, partial [Proteobacteria bacterium]|nr:hypothetical protein [Pseudomonadota bacterium]